jgi:hypothetical protein
VTNLQGGTLSVSSLANGGVASNIGQSSNAASNLVINNAALKYTGAATSTDRLFTLGDSGATVDASGTGALVFTNTGALAYSGSADRLLTLTGTNTDDNTMTPVLANNAGVSSFTKAGTGKWVMKGANTYTGVTTISGGTLNVGDGSDALASLGTNAVSIDAGTTLNFSHNAAVTVANAISGAGQLNKLGGNTLRFTGVNSYTGATGTGTAGGLVFTNNTAPTTVGFTGSGAVTIEPSTSFTTAGGPLISNYTFANTISGFTWGKSSNVADLTVASPFSIAGPISLYGGNISLNANVSSSLANAALLFKASGNVTQASNVALSSNGGDITLWANSDGDTTHYGGITLNTGASISSQNGNVTLGGGSALATGYATNKTTNVGSWSDAAAEHNGGVALFNASINAGTGAVTVRGESVGSADDFAMGILLRGDAGTSSITGGDITLVGISNNAGNTEGNGSSNRGISLINSSITGSGAVSLNGTGSAGVGGSVWNNSGIHLNASTVSSTGSSVSLNGTGRGVNAGADGVGMTQTSSLSAATLLTVTGATSQAASSALTMGAQSMLTAGGAMQISGNAPIVLGNLDSTGTLSISTTSGSVTQTVGTTVSAADTTSLSMANADVTLDNAGNNMVGLISVTNAANLTLRSTTLTMNSVTTSDAQVYNSPVVLPANTTFDGTQVTFNQAVTGAGSLTVNGVSILNGATINTTGAQTYNGAVTLGANTILSTGGTAGVNFVGTIEGSYSLIVNSAGATVFGGAVGTEAALTSVTTDQAGSVEINGGLVRTTGAQTYNERMSLGAGTVLRGVNVALMSTVDGAQVGGQGLTIYDSGTTVLGGSIGGFTPLASLITDSLTTANGQTHIKGAVIHTTTDVVFNDIVKIFTDVRVTASRDMTFAQTIDGDIASTRSLKLDGADTATINVGGIVGYSPLKTLEVVNSRSATFNAHVTAATSIVLTDSTNSIAFNAGLTTPTLTVEAQPFALTLRGPVSVTNAVTLANSGYVQLGGGGGEVTDNLYFAGGLVATAPSGIAMGGVVHSDNSAIALGRIGTTLMLYANTDIDSGTGSLRMASTLASEGKYQLRMLSTGPTTIDGNLTSAGALSLAGPVTFTGPSTITAPSMTFGGSVTAQGALTIHGATVINGDSVNSGSFTQTYNGTVDISGAATSTTTFTGVGITFGGTLDATSRVLVNDSGATTYTGAIGLTHAPAHFETNAAGSSTFSGGTVRTSSSNSIYIADDAVVTAALTTFDTTNNGALTTGANITFAKTLNGSGHNLQAVTLNAGTDGKVLVTGTIGNSGRLSTLTLVNSNGATFNNSVTTDTSVVLSDTSDAQVISFAGNLTTPMLTIAAEPYVLELLGASTSITGANVTNFANTGALRLGDLVGDSLSFTGGLTATAPSGISAAGQISTSGAAAMTLGDNNTVVTLTKDVSLATGGAALTIGGAVEGTLANAQSLTLNAGSTGAISVAGTVGLYTPLNTLTVSNSNGASFSAEVKTNTGVVLTDTTATRDIIFAGNLTTPTLTTFGTGYNLKLLGARTTVTSNTVFNHTGRLTLGDAASDILNFTAGLTATAPSSISAAGHISTSGVGTITLGDANTGMTLTDHVWLTTAGGALSVGGWIEGTAAGAQSLTLDATSAGQLSVAGTTGAITHLQTLTLVHSNGATFTGQVKADTSVVLTDTTATKTISFAGDLITPTLSTTGNGYNLELLGAHTTISNGAVFNQTGTLTLGDAATDALVLNGGLTATAPSHIRAAGRISATNADVIFGSAPLVLADDVEITVGSGHVTFGGTINTASGVLAKSLTVNSTGTTTFTAAVGSASELSSLSTNADGTLAINGGVVKTTGSQSYGEATTLGADTVLTSTAGNAISFTSTIDGPHSLEINTAGATTLGGAVGSGVGTALSSLTTDSAGTLAINGGVVTTTDAQIYGEASTLGADTLLTSSAGRTIRFDKTLNSASVNNAKSLTVNTTGTTAFYGAVGNTAPLSNLTTNALGMVLIDGGTVITTGTQTFHDMVSLLSDTNLTASTVQFDAAVMGSGNLNVLGNAKLNGGTISTTLGQSYSGAVTLGNDTTLDSSNAGDITFASTINGAHSLAVNTEGDTRFGGIVGASAPLTSLTTNAGGTVLMNAGAITTTGAQTYDDVMTIGRAAVLHSSGGADIIFAQTIDGAYDLTVNTAGMTTLAGAVDVRSLSISGESTHTGGSVLTSQAQTYGDTITLGADTHLRSTFSTINFTSVSDASATFNLDIHSHTAQVLAVIDIGGNLHVTTDAGGVSQPAGVLTVGGTTTFTADTGTNQVANLNSANNQLTGLLAFNEANGGSWADVTVVTASALTLAPLQSAGTVTLDTQGNLTTDSITASGSLVVNTHGADVSLGAATVSVDMTIQSDGGNVTQTGAFNVTRDTVVSAGTGAGAGSISLEYEVIDNSFNPPLYVSNTFGRTLALTGNSTSVATSGNLRLSSVTNTGPMSLRAPSGSINLGTAFITGGDLTLVSRDDMNLGGANISGDLHMTSTAGDVSFGSATVAGDLTAETQGGVVDLGNALVGGNLDVQTQGGNIVQTTTAGASLTVAGTSNLNAGTGDITLPNLPNSFADAITLQAANVELVATNGLILANSTVTGTLNVTAATGNITQTGALNVAGVTTLSATQGDVVLEQANVFAQPVVVDAVNATIYSDAPLVLGASTVAADLLINVAQGDVTQVGALTVGGKADVTTLAGNVTLTEALNSFTDTVSVNTSGTLSLTTNGPLTIDKVTTVGDTVLNSTGKIDLGTSTFGAKVNVTSGGFDIIQSGPIKVGGNSDFNAGNAKIDLFNPKNQWSGSILYKGGIVMINHPQLMNAVNAGTLVVRVETSVVQPAKLNAATASGSGSSESASASGAKGGSAVTISVAKPASSGQAGLISVAVSSEVAAPGSSFSFSIESHVPAAAATAEVKVTQVDGKPLPEWLRYEAGTKTFVATTVPPGAFPLQLKVGIGGVETLMVINEKPPGK